MTNSILPLANWGMGTALIIFFAVLCVGLSAMVLYFVFNGKSKSDEDVTSPEEDNL